MENKEMTVTVSTCQKVEIDERERLRVLDEDTRNAYLGHPVEKYDPSVFVVAEVQEGGKKELFVPYELRMTWFRVDYPDCVIIVDPPVNMGTMTSICVAIYRTQDDFKAQIPAIRLPTIFNPRETNVTRVCNRLIGNALGLLGYGLPRDAHEIEKWTTVRVVAENEVGAQRTDDGLVVQSLEPGIVIPSTFTQVTSVDVNTPAPTPAQAPAKRGRKPVTPATPPVAAPATAPVANSATVAAKPATSVAPVEKAATPAVVEGNVDEKAAAAFPTVEAAKAYTSSLLQGQSVGEQPPERIKYYAQKTRDGRVIRGDEKLGLACIVVFATMK